MTKELQKILSECGLEPQQFEEEIICVASFLAQKKYMEAWRVVSKKILNPSIPFEQHQYLLGLIYKESAIDPVPCWIPGQQELDNSNIGKLQKKLGKSSYKELHSWSIKNRVEFWDTMVDELGIQFKTMPKGIFQNNKDGSIAWMPHGSMNIYDSCIKAASDQVAIVYQDHNGIIVQQTYAELDHECNRVARGLQKLGLHKGDAVAIDMVMTIESIAIYLGILRAGCIAVSIADSLAPNEIEKRLSISNAKLLFTQDVIIRGNKTLSLYDKILEANPDRIVVLPLQDHPMAQLRSQDLLWNDFLADNTNAIIESMACEPMDTINILFSSGTTGEPKAIPWNHTTPIKCAADGFLHHDIKEGEVVCWPTNLGWMMGPWLIFATLINNGVMALCYSPPTGRDFIEFVRNVRVNMLGVVPSIVKQWRLGNLLDEMDWSSVKNFSSTGESSNAEDMFWMMSKAGYKPVIEYCGGTEIGGGYITGTMVQPAAPACFTTPALGLDILMMDENERKSNKGEVFIIPPSIGLSVALLNKNHFEEYFQNTPHCDGNIEGSTGVKIEKQKGALPKMVLRRHGDEIEQINSGFYRAHGRVDDTMNLGGIKVSSVEIESTLNQLNGVKETAAIGINNQGGPSELIIYAVLEEEQSWAGEELTAMMQGEIKNKLNPLFKIKEAHIVTSLPRTASNKVMRRELRNRYLSRN